MKRAAVGAVNLFMFDPFEIFGLPKSFSLDLKALETRYFEEQKKVHPDRFAMMEGREKQEALEASTRLNQAYLLLKDPLKRAAYLVESAGFELLSHDGETLSRVMGWNEKIEAGETLINELEAEASSLLLNIENGFEDKDYEKVRLSLYRMTYVQKLLKEMRRV
jgi:molecular chaperone HscB